jgi:hypothetical protein
LNYNFLKDEHSIKMVMENPLYNNDYPAYYEHSHHGLRHHPIVINKIARVTFMSKSGNKDKVRGLYWNLISHAMHGNKVDIIVLIMDQLADLMVNLEMNLYFAPYIMSLIKAKTRFKGTCECKHNPFRPFENDIAFLQRPFTPFPDVEVEQKASDSDNEGAAGDQAPNVEQQAMPPPPLPMQPQWVPPAGYFDPYFPNMQLGMRTQVEGLANQMQ